MEKLERFLRETKLYPDIVDMEETIQQFSEEMEKGLRDEPSSLQMIPSYIGDNFHMENGEKIAVVDAGGTNLRVSRVVFTDQGSVIEDFRKAPIPGAREPVSVGRFFDYVAASLREIAPDAQKAGFCFSFPVEIMPDGDGKVLSMNKEVVVQGIEGELIGRQLNQSCRRLGLEPFQEVRVVNDTAAALLGGRSVCQGPFSSYVGFILGTGMNCCYYEQNGNIHKAPALAATPGRTIINMESGFFNRMPRGAVEEAFGAKTLHPEDSLMEKMTGGQYLGPLCHAYLQAACEAGLFSLEAGRSLAHMELETKDLGIFLEGGEATCLATLKGEDRELAVGVTLALYERAARLVAANIAACVLRSGKAEIPTLITIEGTTYYRSPVLRQKIESHLKEYLSGRGYSYQLAQVDEAVTHGTALAAVGV